MTSLALPARWEERPHSHDTLTAHTLLSAALPRTRMHPGHLRATTEIAAPWKGGGKAQHCFWRQGTTEKPQGEILASTLMAQRPMARTALRTKSTSTSVAYSFSSARTCGDSTAMSAPGDTQRAAHHHRWCCLGTRRWAGYPFTATTHIQPKSAISPLVWLYWCLIQTRVGYTWCRLDKDKRWPGLDYFQSFWTRAEEKLALPNFKVSIPSCTEKIFAACKALGNNHFWSLLFCAEMNLWIPGESKQKMQRRSEDTLEHLYTD